MTASQQVGTDLLQEIIHTIKGHELRRPRNGQTLPGPSDLGTPCQRKLGYKLAGTPKLNTEPSWRPMVGTAVDEWLTAIFAAVTLPDGQPRYLVNQPKLVVGQINGQPVHGSYDAYDTCTQTVIDWKCLSTAGVRRTRSKGIGGTYRTQRHLYARGLQLTGTPVAYVANIVMPKSGDFHEFLIDIEPYDEQVAVTALARAEATANALNVPGIHPGMLPAVDDYCTFCAWYSPGATDTATSCPGMVAAPKPAISLV